jgi:ABC-type amino acid transport substrate-binding protein
MPIRRFAVLTIIAVLSAGGSALGAPQGLRVGVIDDQHPCSDIAGKNFRGSAVEVWQQVAGRTNQIYQYERIANPEEGIRKASAGEVDLVISCLNITPLRIQRVAFTTPYTEDGFALLSRKREPSFALTIKKLLTSKVIRETTILLFAGGLVFAIILWFLSREFQHRDIVGESRRQTFFKGWMMLAMGTGIYKMGTAPPSMSVIAITNFLRLVITSIFVAATTSLVISESAPANLSDEEIFKEALKSKIGVDAGTSAQDWLDRRADSIQTTSEQLKSIVPIRGSDEMLHQLESGKIGSLLADRDTILALRGKLENANDYAVIGETFFRTPQAFAARTTLDSNTLQAINHALSELRFEGEIELIRERWRPKRTVDAAKK